LTDPPAPTGGAGFPFVRRQPHIPQAVDLVAAGTATSG